MYLLCDHDPLAFDAGKIDFCCDISSIENLPFRAIYFER